MSPVELHSCVAVANTGATVALHTEGKWQISEGILPVQIWTPSLPSTGGRSTSVNMTFLNLQTHSVEMVGAAL